MKSNTILILHDIRSAQNVGSLFRTADAVGIDKIYLSAICPLPIDRFGRPVGAIAKTALGAQHTIPWESYSDIKKLIALLQKEEFHIIAIEQSPHAIDYKTISQNGPTAFILGNEVHGITQDILDSVDTITHIPMRGQKESLNVSVAGGIVLFRILDQ